MSVGKGAAKGVGNIAAKGYEKIKQSKSLRELYTEQLASSASSAERKSVEHFVKAEEIDKTIKAGKVTTQEKLSAVKTDDFIVSPEKSREIASAKIKEAESKIAALNKKKGSVEIDNELGNQEAIIKSYKQNPEQFVTDKVKAEELAAAKRTEITIEADTQQAELVKKYAKEMQVSEKFKGRGIELREKELYHRNAMNPKLDLGDDIADLGIHGKITDSVVNSYKNMFKAADKGDVMPYEISRYTPDEVEYTQTLQRQQHPYGLNPSASEIKASKAAEKNRPVGRIEPKPVVEKNGSTGRIEPKPADVPESTITSNEAVYDAKRFSALRPEESSFTLKPEESSFVLRPEESSFESILSKQFTESNLPKITDKTSTITPNEAVYDAKRFPALRPEESSFKTPTSIFDKVIDDTKRFFTLRPEESSIEAVLKSGKTAVTEEVAPVTMSRLPGRLLSNYGNKLIEGGHTVSGNAAKYTGKGLEVAGVVANKAVNTGVAVGKLPFNALGYTTEALGGVGGGFGTPMGIAKNTLKGVSRISGDVYNATRVSDTASKTEKIISAMYGAGAKTTKVAAETADVGLGVVKTGVNTALTTPAKTGAGVIKVATGTAVKGVGKIIPHADDSNVVLKTMSETVSEYGSVLSSEGMAGITEGVSILKNSFKELGVDTLKLTNTLTGGSVKADTFTQAIRNIGKAFDDAKQSLKNKIPIKQSVSEKTTAVTDASTVTDTVKPSVPAIAADTVKTSVPVTAADTSGAVPISINRSVDPRSAIIDTLSPEPLVPKGPFSDVKEQVGRFFTKRPEDYLDIYNNFFKSGGMLDTGHIKGPGTGTSDSILTTAKPGTFIIKASSVNKVGRKNLDNMFKFNSGGEVPIYVSNGEYAVGSDKVSKYGVSTLETINNKGILPSFAVGGSVKGKEEKVRYFTAYGDDVAELDKEGFEQHMASKSLGLSKNGIYTANGDNISSVSYDEYKSNSIRGDKKGDVVYVANGDDIKVLTRDEYSKYKSDEYISLLKKVDSDNRRVLGISDVKDIQKDTVESTIPQTSVAYNDSRSPFSRVNRDYRYSKTDYVSDKGVGEWGITTTEDTLKKQHSFYKPVIKQDNKDNTKPLFGFDAQYDTENYRDALVRQQVFSAQQEELKKRNTAVTMEDRLKRYSSGDESVIASNGVKLQPYFQKDKPIDFELQSKPLGVSDNSTVIRENILKDIYNANPDDVAKYIGNNAAVLIDMHKRYESLYKNADFVKSLMFNDNYDKMKSEDPALVASAKSVYESEESKSEREKYARFMTDLTVAMNDAKLLIDTVVSGGTLTDLKNNKIFTNLLDTDKTKISPFSTMFLFAEQRKHTGLSNPVSSSEYNPSVYVDYMKALENGLDVNSEKALEYRDKLDPNAIENATDQLTKLESEGKGDTPEAKRIKRFVSYRDKRISDMLSDKKRRNNIIDETDWYKQMVGMYSNMSFDDFKSNKVIAVDNQGSVADLIDKRFKEINSNKNGGLIPSFAGGGSVGSLTADELKQLEVYFNDTEDTVPQPEWASSKMDVVRQHYTRLTGKPVPENIESLEELYNYGYDLNQSNESTSFIPKVWSLPEEEKGVLSGLKSIVKLVTGDPAARGIPTNRSGGLIKGYADGGFTGFDTLDFLNTVSDDVSIFNPMKMPIGILKTGNKIINSLFTGSTDKESFLKDKLIKEYRMKNPIVSAVRGATGGLVNNMSMPVMHTGGFVQHTGPAFLQEGELVLPKNFAEGGSVDNNQLSGILTNDKSISMVISNNSINELVNKLNEVELSVEDKKLELVDNKVTISNIDDIKNIKLAVDYESVKLSVDTSNVKIPVDITGLSIPVDVAGKSVTVDTSNVKIPVDITGLSIPVDITNTSVKLDLGDAELKLMAAISKAIESATINVNTSTKTVGSDAVDKLAQIVSDINNKIYTVNDKLTTVENKFNNVVNESNRINEVIDVRISNVKTIIDRDMNLLNSDLQNIRSDIKRVVQVNNVTFEGIGRNINEIRNHLSRI